MATYVPAKGDVVAVSLDPQAGHEQRGRRPALVISNTLFNRRTGMAILCPITNTKRDFPLHVALPDGASVTGSVMVEQVKSVDCRARRVRFIEAIPEDTLREVLGILDALIY